VESQLYASQAAASSAALWGTLVRKQANPFTWKGNKGCRSRCKRLGGAGSLTELVFQYGHLVLNSKFELFKSDFFKFFVFGEIAFLGEIF
jgi:hypothetical protein